jgi:hypothetical protein
VIEANPCATTRRCVSWSHGAQWSMKVVSARASRARVGSS